MKFWDWEGKPYCTKCFDSLPEDVKRRIIRKQKVERTVEGYRVRTNDQKKAKDAKEALRVKQKQDAILKAEKAAARQKAIDRRAA
jgi:hypothetical protein